MAIAVRSWLQRFIIAEGLAGEQTHANPKLWDALGFNCSPNAAARLPGLSASSVAQTVKLLSSETTIDTL